MQYRYIRRFSVLLVFLTIGLIMMHLLGVDVDAGIVESQDTSIISKPGDGSTGVLHEAVKRVPLTPEATVGMDKDTLIKNLWAEIETLKEELRRSSDADKASPSMSTTATTSEPMVTRSQVEMRQNYVGKNILKKHLLLEPSIGDSVHKLGEHVIDIFDVNATANDVFKKTLEQTSGCYTKLLQMAPAEGEATPERPQPDEAERSTDRYFQMDLKKVCAPKVERPLPKAAIDPDKVAYVLPHYGTSIFDKEGYCLLCVTILSMVCSGTVDITILVAHTPSVPMWQLRFLTSSFPNVRLKEVEPVVLPGYDCRYVHERLTKIRYWGFTEYEQIMQLDTDIVVVQSLDALLTHPLVSFESSQKYLDDQKAAAEEQDGVGEGAEGEREGEGEGDGEGEEGDGRNGVASNGEGDGQRRDASYEVRFASVRERTRRKLGRWGVLRSVDIDYNTGLIVARPSTDILNKLLALVPGFECHGKVVADQPFMHESIKRGVLKYIVELPTGYNCRIHFNPMTCIHDVEVYVSHFAAPWNKPWSLNAKRKWHKRQWIFVRLWHYYQRQFMNHLCPVV